MASMDDGWINIRVIWTDGTDCVVKMRKLHTFLKLKEVYAERTGVDLQKLRFIHFGNQLYNNETPEDKDLRDWEAIEAYQQEVEERKMFKCSIRKCRDAFTTHHELKQHYRRHYKNDRKAGKTIKCDRCWRLFEKRAHLMVHMRAHLK